jgi:hypothetical protein
MALNGTLDGLVEEMERLMVQAEAEAETARIAYEKAKGEVKRLHDMLRVAGVIEAPQKSKQKQAKPGSEKVSDETRAAVLAAINERRALGVGVIPDVPGSFTAQSLGDAGVHESSVRKTLYILRDEGLIRAVGTVPTNSPRKPTAYALVPVEDGH